MRLFQPETIGLARGAAAASPVAPRPRPARTAHLSDRLPLARLHAARTQLARLHGELSADGALDLTVDLGHRIGSRSWWRGLAMLLGLITMALTLALAVPPLPGLLPQPLTASQREDWRPLGVAPLARGGTTGYAALPAPGRLTRLAEPPERPRIELSARLGASDSFESLLRRSGVSRSDIADVVALARPAASLGKLPRGAQFDLVLGRRETKAVPRPLESLTFRAAFDLKLAVTRGAAGDLALTRIPIPIDSTPLRVQGNVGTSIQRSLRAAGVPAPQAGDYVKAMQFVVDFQHGIGKRDRFDIVVEQDRAETGEVRYGGVLYGAITRKGRDRVEIGRWHYAGKPQFFRASGESARKGLMQTPVDGARMTSGFGMRFHPLLSYSRMHQGVDFGAGHGSPIYAAANGKVTFAGKHGGHGNFVQLRHNTELVTGYAHMSRFAVRPGQSVAQGQIIGYVGSTGLSTGPHLHYEVWLRGRPVNPMQIKFIGGTKLAGNELAQFLAFMNRMRGAAVTGS